MARADGRAGDELRTIKFTKNYIKHAASVLVEFGDTKVLVCATYENTKPKWMPKDETGGWLTAEYSLLPASTNTRCARERAKLSGRTQEIQRLIGRSLRAAIDLKKLTDKTITIDADVLQADGGTRTASICGGYVVLEDLIKKLLASGELAENPIKEPIGAISAGISGGQTVVDLNYEEDSKAQADANIVMTKSGKIIEFQTTAEDGPFEREKLVEILNVATKAIKEIIEKY